MVEPQSPNVLSLTRVNHTVRSTDLTTKREAARVFAAEPAVHVLAIASSVLVGGRLWAGLFDRGDAVAAVVSLTFVVLVERAGRHRVARAIAPLTRRWPTLGTARGRHHGAPAEIRWLMLTGVEAAVSVLVLGAIVALWAAPVGWALGASAPGTILTGWAVAVLGLAHTEWVHLLSHSSCRPGSRHSARIVRAHRRHHHLDEHAWLGVAALAANATSRLPSSSGGPIAPPHTSPPSTMSTLSLR